MDKTPVQSWSWLPQQMPGVAKLIAEKRRKLGDAHVNECWRRGVGLRERGWFFAAEGALMVGAPFDDPDLQPQLLQVFTSTQALLILRPMEPAHGA